MLEPIRSSRLYKRAARLLLALDAYIDSSLFDSSRGAREAYENFSAFMNRFQVRGLRRVAVEIGCESLTLALGGGLVALALSVSAMRMTSDDWLKKQDLSITFLDRYGAVAGQRGIKHDDAVPLDQYPDYVIKAVLATEDRRFYEHFGIDIIGTGRALTVNARSSGVVQGGSSITQQLAKNVFLSNERTLTRKINEAFLALWLEERLTKQEILKLYLDRVYMGGGAFGIQAAAEFYFGKSVRDVSLSEAAMLAGLFKAPTKYAPHVNLPAARARANDVLDNLVDAGFMTQSQIVAAQRNPATPVERKRDQSPDWYLDFAFKEAQRLAEAGKFGDDRVLVIRTALDPNVQKRADEVVEENLRESGRSYHAKQSASAFMDLDGAVRALVGGRDYGASQFNRATEAARQPGSSFKPYVYLTALMSNKFKPTTVVTDRPTCIGNYCVHNYSGGYAGSLPLSLALAKSLNTIAIQLSIAIGNGDSHAGRAKIIDTCRKLGITTPLEDTPSLPVGQSDVILLEHAAGYAAFANGGKKTTPYAATEVRNSRGDILYQHDRDAPPQEQVVPFEKVAELDTMMKRVIDEGTGGRANLGPGIDVIGKTGTTNGYKDAWFCGYTGNMGGCVWYGNDDNEGMSNMTGGTLPAKTWHDIMAYAHQGIAIKPIRGLATPATLAAAAAAQPKTLELGAPARPAALSRGALEALGQIESKMKLDGPERPAAGSQPQTRSTDKRADRR
ncbi:penicillin-binding protein [Methylosinus sp. R-45379]|uniref:transglycosylase domain-containing protein n=1 Tax=unclassified Methylosinus TaxID=2624500 RepID=UPI000466ED2D|nr:MULTISPECIES: PBP1A family penicillin-binding protein [unclassified Methylosinus]OAI29696.1 penicillin-binding protein [Methylosinus sp. R-45379]TDX65622.1 penicillin-binding protein 1A [Methylosinus sp. sav-2]